MLNETIGDYNIFKDYDWIVGFDYMSSDNNWEVNASENIGNKIDESKMFVRINRFSNAFSYMFSNLKFDRIINSNDHKDVLFRNNKGDEIRIDDLSTGEKQIVIRGGYILKYQKSIQSNFILIDEPELSLHPEWQKKILQFYKRLFTDENGSQMIILQF